MFRFATYPVDDYSNLPSYSISPNLGQDGQRNKALKEFITNIPASKLTGFSTNIGTIYTDTNFRLDMQKINTDKTHNLQIQANKQSGISTIKNIAPSTVAGPVHAKTDADPEAVRKQFMDSIKI